MMNGRGDITQRIVFLASGGGGNMRFIHRAIEDGQLPGSALVGVIADRDCHALAYCAAKGIAHEIVRYTRKEPEALRSLLDAWAPDVIVTNLHKIIDAETVRAFHGRMINLHYSLLPAFGGVIGAEPVRQALAHNCTIIGTTVHYVSEEVDAGAVISQSALPVWTKDLDLLMNDIFRSGCVNLLNAISIVAGGAGGVPPSPGFISPAPAFDVSHFPEALWSDISNAC